MGRLAPLVVIAVCCAGSLCLCGCQRPDVASTEPVAAPPLDWTPYFFVGKVGDISLSIVEVGSEERPFRVLVARGDSETVYDYWSAEILPDGTVLMADLSAGLIALNTDGSQKTLLAPGQVGRLIESDASGSWLAFEYPVEYSLNFVLKGGMGVYDIQTGERRLLYFQDPPAVCFPVGWLGQSVVFYETDFSTILEVDLTGSVSVLTKLPHRPHRILPMKGDLLAYEIIGGGRDAGWLGIGDVKALLLELNPVEQEPDFEHILALLAACPRATDDDSMVSGSTS